MGFLSSDEDDDDSAVTAGFDEANQISGSGKHGMKRVVDEEAGVVIYAIDGGNTYSIAAVPLSDTDLD